MNHFSVVTVFIRILTRYHKMIRTVNVTQQSAKWMQCKSCAGEGPAAASTPCSQRVLTKKCIQYVTVFMIDLFRQTS